MDSAYFMNPDILMAYLCLFFKCKLDRHIMSSNSACMWSNSKVLHDARQAHSIGKQSNTIHVGQMTSFMGQNLHKYLS